MPDVIVASRPFCEWCRSMLIEGGATLMSDTEADLSSTTRSRLRAAVAEEIDRWRHMAAGELVHINSDGAEDLERLHGVGPALAARIVAARPFETDEDLPAISGIGATKLAGIRTNLPSFDFR